MASAQENSGGFVINAGLSGAWFEQDTAGQGMTFDVVPGANLITGGWFTFATNAEDGQRWLTFQGEIHEGQSQLVVFQTLGGRFDANEPVTTQAIGSATVEFLSCDAATFTYQLDSGLAGQIVLQRIVPSDLCHALSDPGGALPETISATSGVAFVGANVVTLVGSEGVLPGHTLVVRNGVIESIEATGRRLLADDLIKIDARDMYLGPGLTDFHTHLDIGGLGAAEDAGLLNIANGVTTVLNMGDGFTVGIPEIAARYESNEIIGPTMLTGNVAYGQTGNGIRTIETPAEATEYAERLAFDGYDYIKEYWFLPPLVLAQFEIESLDKGLPIIGHIPRTRPMAESLSKGHLLAAHIQEPYVTHMNSRQDDRLLAEAIDLFVQNDTYLSPTLAVFESYKLIYGGNREAYDQLLDRPGVERTRRRVKTSWLNYFNSTQVQGAGQTIGGDDLRYAYFESMVKAFHDGGVPLLLGTDAPALPGLPVGFSVHREMELFAGLGLSPREIYEIAARNAGEFIDKSLRPEISFGTLEVGKRADLLILDENPLENIEALRSPAAVMARGNLWSRDFLDAALSEFTGFIYGGGKSARYASKSQSRDANWEHWMCLTHLSEAQAGH